MADSVGAQPSPHRPKTEMTQDPVIRKVVKVLLDGLVAVVAFCVVSSILLEGNVPFNRGMAVFILMAMVINLGFRLNLQHYRALSIHDARWIMLGTLTLAAGTMSLYLGRGHWPANVKSEVILGASILLRHNLQSTIQLEPLNHRVGNIHFEPGLIRVKSFSIELVLHRLNIDRFHILRQHRLTGIPTAAERHRYH